ncbi:MAG TPA: hypothetical protein VD968_09205 [Pyrinomonadaceae bacterium]|nr:hypothetical protein [Pyrinomonadaceae bacterium]
MRFQIRTVLRAVSVLAIALMIMLGAGLDAYAHGKNKRWRRDNGRHLGWTIGRHRGWEHSRSRHVRDDDWRWRSTWRRRQARRARREWRRDWRDGRRGFDRRQLAARRLYWRQYR